MTARTAQLVRVVAALTTRRRRGRAARQERAGGKQREGRVFSGSWLLCCCRQVAHHRQRTEKNGARVSLERQAVENKKRGATIRSCSLRVRFLSKMKSSGWP